jgi:hypothetical protein
MAELDAEHRKQIERELGRPLTPAELEPAANPAAMSTATMLVARQLRGRQLVLCALYLKSVTSMTGAEAIAFVDRIEPLPEK